MDFEKLLREHCRDVERFVKFRLPSGADAEDVLQEVFLAAFRQFPSLKSEESFKAWVLGIARHKCNDYFRKRAKLLEIPIEDVSESRLCYGGCGITEAHAAWETLGRLGDKEKQILYLYFWEELPQTDIAARLNIPVGTVKSRLYTAKQKFREQYPYQPRSSKGEMTMNNLQTGSLQTGNLQTENSEKENSLSENLQTENSEKEILQTGSLSMENQPIKKASAENLFAGALPRLLPEYAIKSSSEPPFAVRHEELPGMLIIPRAGEELSFGMYDLPERKRTGVYHLKVTGGIDVHGVRGVEIASQYLDSDGSKEDCAVFAQLTDSHCRYLGGMAVGKDGIRRITTFLDGDSFSEAYAIGEDNCGFEVERSPKGVITACGSGLATDCTDDVSDIVGRFEVTINGKTYDTVRLIDIQTGGGSYMLCEYYLDKNGRTVLWRRFNHDEWAIERYGKRWTEALPDNERMTVNGEAYVHWYDCITDYICG